ncbi:MAG TPA: hypothetical protein VH599_13265 [Ktedonobacterales bacterium]|jgi:hypothetical protein
MSFRLHRFPQQRAVGNAFLLSICLAYSILLAGCDSSSAGAVANAPTATPTAMLIPTPTSTPTPTPTIPPPPPQPAPIPPHGWATHTSSKYHYTIQYPANWFALGDFDVWNFNVEKFNASYINPPLLKIEVLPAPNPSQLSPSQFYTQDQQNSEGPPCSDPTTHATTVGGHDALEAICPSQNDVEYFVSGGPYMFIIGQLNAVKGQPSPVFPQMIASFTFTD